MNWSKLPKGPFTGIDWSKPGAINGFDPYLVWAEADGFGGHGNKAPTWLPVAIELAAGVDIKTFLAAGSSDWLRVPFVYLSAAAPRGLRFCTAKVRPAFFPAIQPGGQLHGLVARLELGLPAGSGTIEPPVGTAYPEQVALLTGTVFGLIDDGVAFAHTNFLQGSQARVRYFWRQDSKGVGEVPAAMGYGHELTGKDIEAAIARRTYAGLTDESLVYSDLELPQLQKATSHGTHVLDLACGPRAALSSIANLPPGFNSPPEWAPAQDPASAVPIVAVQLDYETVADTSGGSMNVHVLDGLLYTLSRCAPDATVVVNISFGTLAGPHDGTSLLEAAMDQLMTLNRGRLKIVLAAGNSYQLRTHANLSLPAHGEAHLHWRVQPDDATQSFVELWLPPGAKGIAIELTPPGCAALPALAFGQAGLWLDGGVQPLCALIYPESAATGQQGTCALIALAATSSFDPQRKTAASGIWNIKLVNDSAQAATLDAYIERDDVVIGARSGARQSHFEDQWYDTSGNPGSFVDNPDNKTLIRRSGNFNSIATGARTLSVGGNRVSDADWARYSPRDPDPDASRAHRPDVVKVPKARGYSDENAALTGMKAAGTRSGAVVRLAGTSVAAPQEARRLVNGFGAATSAREASSST